MMTRKDYIQFALFLRSKRPAHDAPGRNIRMRQWRADCEAVAAVLMNDNPRFDQVRFIAACEQEDRSKP